MLPKLANVHVISTSISALVTHNNYETVLELIEKNVIDPNCVLNGNGQTILSLFLERGMSAEAIKRLLELGAEPNAPPHSPPLSSAIYISQEIANTLLHYGAYPSHFCSSANRERMNAEMLDQFLQETELTAIQWAELMDHCISLKTGTTTALTVISKRLPTAAERELRPYLNVFLYCCL